MTWGRHLCQKPYRLCHRGGAGTGGLGTSKVSTMHVGRLLLSGPHPLSGITSSPSRAAVTFTLL